MNSEIKNNHLERSERSLLKGISRAAHSKWLIASLFIFSFFFFAPRVFAATIFVSPGSGSVGVGSTFTVSVRTDTQGAAVNTAEATISYPTDLLDLVSASQGSTFYLASPGSPTKSSGSVYFGGGLPTPGYTGSSGTIGSITFRAKATGSATISVASGKVLLNDGNGTDAYSGSSSSHFTITPPPIPGPVVSSSTDPDPNSWYDKSAVTLSWTRPDNAYGFSFQLDQDPNGVPDNTLDTTITTTKDYTDLKDGIYYFHIKARPQSTSSSFGALTTFKVQVDTQPPKLFDIKLVNETDVNSVSRTPTINYEAIDDTSGIDHYAVAVDDQQVSDNAPAPYSFKELSNGSHTIVVTAYDKAGNLRKSQLAIIVAGPQVIGFFQRNLSLPIYLLFLMNFIILILLIVIVWMLVHRRRRVATADSITDLQQNVDEALEKLRHDIDHKLLTLTSKNSDELFNSQTKVAKSVDSDIGKTKRKIEDKIDRASRKR